MCCQAISYAGEDLDVVSAGSLGVGVEVGLLVKDGCLMNLQAHTHLNDRLVLGAEVQNWLPS